MQLPHFSSTTIDGKRVTVDGLIPTQPVGITLDSSNTDAGSTPTHRFRKGNVVVYKTSAKRYVEANDSTGDGNSVATVTSLEAADTDWDGTIITVQFDGVAVEVAVVLAGTDDTTAEVVTALNAAFAARNLPLEASGTNGNPVVIKATVGGHHSLKVTQSVITTGFGADGTEDTGGDADYLVTCQDADLKDEEGNAIHATVLALRTGHFYVPNLINLTSAARAALKRRGAKFSDE